MKALVVLSGGQDSTTCLYWAIHNGFEVHAVTFDYGQRHVRELESAAIIAGMSGINPYNYECVKLGEGILKGSSPLVSNAQLEQYKDHSVLPGGLEKTFVPMRNQLFLTVAANRAFCIGADVLVTGVCEEDYGGYPDCRRAFIDALQTACRLGTFTKDSGYGIQGKVIGNTGAPDFDDVHEERNFKIITPLMHLTKAQTVLMARDIPGCYKALAYSHTAYDGQYPPLGHDHATLLRQKGFEEADVPDPLVLRAWNDGDMHLPDTENYRLEMVERYLPWIL